MPEIKLELSRGAKVTVSDQWKPEQREGEGRLVIADGADSLADIAISASEAALLSNALSKLAWSIARRGRAR